jgi:hypothetical protein
VAAYQSALDATAAAQTASDLATSSAGAATLANITASEDATASVVAAKARDKAVADLLAAVAAQFPPPAQATMPPAGLRGR